jgi:hypothetical protein
MEFWQLPGGQQPVSIHERKEWRVVLLLKKLPARGCDRLLLNETQLYRVSAKHPTKSAPVVWRRLMLFPLPPSYRFCIESWVLTIFGTESQNALDEFLLGPATKFALITKSRTITHYFFYHFLLFSIQILSLSLYVHFTLQNGSFFSSWGKVHPGFSLIGFAF